MTDEFQSNRINFSRVYPAVMYLRESLLGKDENNHAVVYRYTEKLRKDLLASLNKRFGNIIKDDIFLVSTFLDPNFGLSAFEKDVQEVVKAKIVALVKICEAKQQIVSSNLSEIVNKENSSQLQEKRKDNYKKHKTSLPKPSDKQVDLLNDYIAFVDQLEFQDCPLQFWKANESKFKSLSEIARKYLGVPASSAAVERMFSISGHILSCKRTKMSIKLFCYLVFLKLNESFL